jgi:hypothetical protein
LATEQHASDAVLVNRRWVKMGNVEWAQQANAILLEHGVVFGTAVYEGRYQARWRARRLITLLVDLGLRDRWELQEHVNRRGDGWAWSVEYIRKGQNG